MSDRNLLFIVLALQNRLVRKSDALEAMNIWITAKQRPIGDILLDCGMMRPDDRQLLDALIDRQIANDGSVDDSLAALDVSSSIEHFLKSVIDPDVQNSLVHVDRPTNGERTGPYQPTLAGLRYRVLRPHAKGGIGEVFVAEDTEVHRHVALKEMQERHAADPASCARFQLEAEITGRLEHPGVVPVYGLGQYADGRPFYAMRFIKGDNLKDAINRFYEAERSGRDSGEQRLAFRQLLRRFIDVCNAVAYAHSRGVLHRDIKPGNIMLGKYGETLVVDWGLAKVAGRTARSASKETDDTEEVTLRPTSGNTQYATLPGVAFGTPAFMSPEQAAGRLEELGPASDIYSLGATLYVLLTSQAPFVDPDPGQLLQKVQRGEFPAPRQIRAVTFPPLDAICLKAMSLMPEDRYATALDLAADVEHWLADEPVAGYPEPWRERGRRWMRRHRTLVTSAAALVVTALVALVFSLIMVENERRQTADERDKKDKALESETLARRLAMSALRKLTDNLVEKQLARQTETTDEDRQFLRDIKKHYEEFASLPGEELVQRAIRAESFHRVGLIQHKLGQHHEAERSYRGALALYHHLSDNIETSPELWEDKAISLNNLGVLLRETGRLNEAESAYAEALVIDTNLANAFPDRPEFRLHLASCHNNLATLFRSLGRTPEAEAAHLKAISVRKQLVGDFPSRHEFRRILAKSQNSLGVFLIGAGRLGDAEQAYLSALSNQKQIAAEFEASPAFRRELAQTHNNLGAIFYTTGRNEKAEMAFAEALSIHTRLAAEFPGQPDFRFQLAQTHVNVGNVHLATKRPNDAETAFTTARDIFRRLADDFPSRPEFRQMLAQAFNNLGNACRAKSSVDEAKSAYTHAITILGELAARFPANPEYRQGLARGRGNLGVLLDESGQLQEAASAYLAALEGLKHLALDFPKQIQHRYELAATLNNLAALENKRRNFSQARTWLDDSQLHHKVTLEASPTHRDYRRSYRIHLSTSVRNFSGLNRGLLSIQTAFQLRDLNWSPSDDAFAGAIALVSCVPIAAENVAANRAEREQLMHFYADHAMQLLKDAVAKGFNDVSQVKKDKDLDPLRQREDFKQLLAELEAKYPESPAKSDAKEERLEGLRLAVCIVAGWPVVR